MGKKEKEKIEVKDLPCRKLLDAFLKEWKKENRIKYIIQVGTMAVMLLAVLFFTFKGGGLFKGFGGAGGYEEVLEWSYRLDKYPDKEPSKVAIISVNGIITQRRSSMELFESSQATVGEIEDQLVAAKNDPAVKAIILDINSPGGEVTASDTLYHEIQRFKEKTKKKVIVYMNGLATSGAYYISCAADEIIAHPTTITGSIGVIMRFTNYEELFKKIGLKEVVFKSGKKKDMGSPLRVMEEEEKEILQNIVDEFYYEKFYAVIIEGRTLGKKENLRLKEFVLSGLSDGRIFTAKEALKYGLIDAVGYFDDAAAEVILLLEAEEEPVKFVRYERVYPLKEMLGMTLRKIGNSFGINISLKNTLQESTPQFLYLWVPNN